MKNVYLTIFFNPLYSPYFVQYLIIIQFIIAIY